MAKQTTPSASDESKEIDMIVLVTTPQPFKLVESDFSIWRYHRVTNGSYLVILKELALTKYDVPSEKYGVPGDWHCVAVVADLAAEVAYATTNGYIAIYNAAKKQYQETGSVNGFEVFELQTLRKLWVSTYDWKILVNIHNKAAKQ